MKAVVKMANSALLSIVALYNYDETILDGIRPFLPTNTSTPDISITAIPIDFDVLKENLLYEIGELSILYSEPTFLKNAIAMWAAKQQLPWQRMFDTLFYDYNPLFNKIREYQLTRNDANTRTNAETTTDSGTKNRTQNDTVNTTIDRTDSSTGSGSNNGTTTHTGNGTENEDIDVKNYKQAYNNIGVDVWAQDTRSVTDRDVTNSDTYTDTKTGSDQFTNSTERDEVDAQTLARLIAETTNKNRNKNGTILDSGELTDIITEKITGQIPFQQLIEMQRNLALYNLYDIIIKQFKERFCVLIY